MPLAYSKYILLRHPKKNDPYIDERGVHVISIDWIDKYIEQAFSKAKRTHERFSNQTHYAFTQGKAKVELTLHRADEQYYLTIEVESRTLKRAVEVLEETEDKLMSTDIQKGYIDIKSYDGVSEYYCNLMYPLLNTLERKLRHLLLNVYTLKFEDTYFEQFDESIQDEAKSRIRQAAKPPFVVPQRRDDFGLKGKELRHVNRIRFFFEAISLGGLETLLFEKRVTDGEREEVAAFQEANEDLGKLPDAELREMFKKLEPRSDWERYFEQKVLYDDIEIAIGKIRETRNTVDHCKGFRKAYFEQARDLANGLIEAIDDAIRITEEEDFEAKNSAALSASIKEMRRSFESISKLAEKALGGISSSLSEAALELGKTSGLSSLMANNLSAAMSSSVLGNVSGAVTSLCSEARSSSLLGDMASTALTRLSSEDLPQSRDTDSGAEEE